ncbi:MAG: YdcF family protein [Clostridia bacterium]|nr:YdcF family protein [Clostridia bacterium]
MKIIKKIFALMICAALLCGIGVLGIDYYVVKSTEKYILTPETAGEGYDCILVLGCGVYGDTPSHMLEDRLLQGIELYELGASEKMLMSGDHGKENYDEVNVMKDFAVERGVSAENIFMDHAGFSTYESMYRAKEIFTAEKILIVTQDYHLHRAIYDARAMGIEAYGVASNPRTYAGQLYRDIREILARNKDFIYCIVKPEPTYLGDEIPVQGNGNVTNDK